MRLSRFLPTLAFNLAFWVGLFTLIFAIRYYGIATIEALGTDVVLHPARIYGNGLLFGTLIAVPYTFVERYMKDRGLYEASLASIMVRRTLAQFAIASAVLIIIAFVNYRLIDTPEAPPFASYLFSPTALFLFLGALLGNALLTTFRTLQMKIGESVFFDLLTGKFRPAREEDRTFLFLDLKSSTTIAEALGHRAYSFLIQDCFQDLDRAVTSSGAHVYQYVGDEAVLTWKTEDAIRGNRCFAAFFAFQDRLDERAAYYEQRYGLTPVFKGGLNAGSIMTAEVGVERREIAYHGDVLNAAARIQAKCNEIGARLLASQNLVDRLLDHEAYSLQDRGEVELRGKQQTVGIYEVMKAHP